MISTPLFDHVFKAGERSIPASVVKRRAIKSQSVAPARRSDPETSQKAASDNREIRGAQRMKVFEFLESVGPKGATDYEIGIGVGCLRTSAGKRRKELLDLGHVEDSGTRRQTDSGASAIVWHIKRAI